MRDSNKLSGKNIYRFTLQEVNRDRVIASFLNSKKETITKKNVIMAIGCSLHIGLNKIDANHYAGSAGRLRGPESDALAMQAIARSMGFTDKIVLTGDAVRSRVITLIRDAAQKLIAGDIFLISYSGHGGLLPNLNTDSEPVEFDQTWCLFDAQIVDDELKHLWGTFRRGVRVLVVTDSCFSGTMLEFHSTSEPERHAKILSPAVLKETYKTHQAFYDEILTRPNIPDNQISASILLLSSCKDNQECLDGPFNSVFTEQLLNVWNNGQFVGSYQNLLDEISTRTPTSQIPQLKGAGIPDQSFLNNQPFKI